MRKIKKTQRGGMCFGSACKWLTRRFRNRNPARIPKPVFPEFEKPTLYNEPPGLEFYGEMRNYLTKLIELKSTPIELQEGCQDVKRFIEMTDADYDTLRILNEVPFLNKSDINAIEAVEMVEELILLLNAIIEENNQNEPDVFFIGYTWAPQVLAKLRAKNLAATEAAVPGGLEALIPGGPGPASIVGEFLGGPKITNTQKGTFRRKRHGMNVKGQLAKLKEVGTSAPGSGVGEGTKILGMNPRIYNGKNHNILLRNYKLHLAANNRNNLRN